MVIAYKLPRNITAKMTDEILKTFQGYNKIATFW